MAYLHLCVVCVFTLPLQYGNTETDAQLEGVQVNNKMSLCIEKADISMFIAPAVAQYSVSPYELGI